MTPEASDRRGGRDVVASTQASRTDLVHSGAELVALSERFYHAIFVGVLGFIAVSTIAALVLLPLRASAAHRQLPVSAVVAGLGVLLLTGLAIWRAHDLYRLLRRRPQLELLPVLIAALLLSVVSPLRTELWWPACAILMALSLLLPLRRALVYCLIALIANLTAHVVSGDLPETSPVEIVGLWIGIPFWTALAGVVPERMASHILRLNKVGAPPRRPPLRVRARTTRATAAPIPDVGEPGSTDPSNDSRRPHHREPPETASATRREVRTDRTSRLTSRQLQVVALLTDGYRYRDIAACLDISPGQVHRHVTNAIARLKVQNVNELSTIAVAEGIVPAPPGRDE